MLASLISKCCCGACGTYTAGYTADYLAVSDSGKPALAPTDTTGWDRDAGQLVRITGSGDLDYSVPVEVIPGALVLRVVAQGLNLSAHGGGVHIWVAGVVVRLAVDPATNEVTLSWGAQTRSAGTWSVEGSDLSLTITATECLTAIRYRVGENDPVTIETDAITFDPLATAYSMGVAGSEGTATGGGPLACCPPSPLLDCWQYAVTLTPSVEDPFGDGHTCSAGSAVGMTVTTSDLESTTTPGRFLSTTLNIDPSTGYFIAGVPHDDGSGTISSDRVILYCDTASGRLAAATIDVNNDVTGIVFSDVTGPTCSGSGFSWTADSSYATDGCAAGGRAVFRFAFAGTISACPGVAGTRFDNVRVSACGTVPARDCTTLAFCAVCAGRSVPRSVTVVSTGPHIPPGVYTLEWIERMPLKQTCGWSGGGMSDAGQAQSMYIDAVDGVPGSLVWRTGEPLSGGDDLIFVNGVNNTCESVDGTYAYDRTGDGTPGDGTTVAVEAVA